ncbi:response regulator [Legionella tunisiensis]|uniref:response regulator n=1 Tax=Legionella tunisiensis TaxID=1034944 RepID=UPI0002EE7D0D|nr:response regulator [Legionella tunisiensis]
MRNYYLSLATTVKEALEYLNRQVFHCILLDIGLPDISGEELLPLIRNHSLNKNTPIIVISSHVNEAIQLKYLQLGANHIYAKPISLNTLQQLVESTLSS